MELKKSDDMKMQIIKKSILNLNLNFCWYEEKIGILLG